MRKAGIITGGILAIALIGVGTYMQRDALRSRFFDDQPDTLPEAVEVGVDTNVPSTVDVSGEAGSGSAGNEPDVQGDVVDLAATTKLPSQFNLAVPFVLQAPTANWDAVHNETCEEAAVLTVHYYWTKVKSFSAPR